MEEEKDDSTMAVVHVNAFNKNMSFTNE